MPIYRSRLSPFWYLACYTVPRVYESYFTYYSFCFSLGFIICQSYFYAFSTLAFFKVFFLAITSYVSLSYHYLSSTSPQNFFNNDFFYLSHFPICYLFFHLTLSFTVSIKALICSFFNVHHFIFESSCLSNFLHFSHFISTTTILCCVTIFLVKNGFFIFYLYFMCACIK